MASQEKREFDKYLKFLTFKVRDHGAEDRNIVPVVCWIGVTLILLRRRWQTAVAFVLKTRSFAQALGKRWIPVARVYYIYVYIHMGDTPCTHPHIHAHLHLHSLTSHTHTLTLSHTHTDSPSHTHTHTFTHTHSHTHSHTHTHILSHTYTHTHTHTLRPLR